MREIELEQTGPGLYEADVPAEQAGSYVVSLMLTESDGTRRTVFGGANRPVNRELRQFRSNAGLLERVAEITGGRVLDPARPRVAGAGLFNREGYDFVTRSVQPLWRTLLIVLLVLVMLDVANRRVAWDPVGIWRWSLQRADAMLGILSRKDTAEAGEPTMASLKAARQRAGSRFATPSTAGGGTAAPAAATSGGNGRTPSTAGKTEAEHAKPKRTFKFEAAPEAEASEDFATAVGGASAADPTGLRLARASRAKAASGEDEPDTTSRLMAAKRAARERMTTGENEE